VETFGLSDRIKEGGRRRERGRAGGKSVEKRRATPLSDFNALWGLLLPLPSLRQVERHARARDARSHLLDDEAQWLRRGDVVDVEEEDEDDEVCQASHPKMSIPPVVRENCSPQVGRRSG